MARLRRGGRPLAHGFPTIFTFAALGGLSRLLVSRPHAHALEQYNHRAPLTLHIHTRTNVNILTFSYKDVDPGNYQADINAGATAQYNLLWTVWWATVLSI